MELREIENEAWEQFEQGDRMEAEVKSHKERVRQLEKAVGELKASLQDVQSDQVRETLAAAEKVSQETEKRLAELRGERDKMLQHNREMMTCVEGAKDKRSGAMETVRLVESFSLDAQSDIRAQVQTMGDALQGDLQRLGSVQKDLDMARGALESLDL